MTAVPLQLAAWQQAYKIPPDAMAGLMVTLGLVPAPPPPPDADKTEAYSQSVVRLEAPYHGVDLFRNNVGVLRDIDGRPVRFGLANDSKQVNETIKSGDLIGWRSLVIAPDMVGRRIAQFVSRECKRPSWTWGGDARERAQLAWANLVTKAGGDAKFVTGPGSFI